MNKFDIVDTSFSIEQAGGSEELAKELFGMLLKELPELREKLACAIADKNWEAMWDHAHKMSGSTAYCGVPALRAKLQTLESAIKEQRSDIIDREFAVTRQEIERVLQIGENFLQESWK